MKYKQLNFRYDPLWEKSLLLLDQIEINFRGILSGKLSRDRQYCDVFRIEDFYDPTKV